MSKKKPSFYFNLIIPVISLVLAYYLWTHVDLSKFFQTLSNPEWKWIALGFAIYLTTVLLRATRWYILIYPKRPWPMLFGLTTIHTLLNNLFPARTGELAYVYYLKQIGQVSAMQGAATLLIARFYDLLALTVLFCLSLLFVWTDIQISIVRFLIGFFVLMPVLMFILIHLFSIKGFQQTISVLKKFFFFKWEMVQKLVVLAEKLIREMDVVSKSGKRRYYFLISFFIWALKFVSFMFILWGIGFQDLFTLNLIIFGSSFSEITTVLPIHGIAGFGTVEGGWTLGFLLLGIDKEIVIRSGFAFHIILLSFSFVVGAFGYIWFFYFKNKKTLGN